MPDATTGSGPTTVTVGFQIGNAEITNLIVQDQVAKVRQKIQKIRDRIDEIMDTLRINEKCLRDHVQTLGVAEWSDRIKRLVLLLCEFGLVPELRGSETREEDYDTYTLDFEYGDEIIFMTRRLMEATWTQHEIDSPPKTLLVRYSLTRQKSNAEHAWSSRIHIPLESHSRQEHLLVTLDDDSQKLISACRALNREQHTLTEERNKLDAVLCDTDNIEKTVLAALTRNTLQGNQDLLRQVGEIVSVIEGGIPQIEALPAE